MSKKLLIAVGDCSYSKEAVKYAAAFTQAAKEMTYTLLNIQAAIPSILLEETESQKEYEREIKSLVLESSDASKCAVRELKELLQKCGVNQDCIDVLISSMESGMAKDILRQAEQEKYDAIVLGSKGLTPRKDFFVGTTATKVIEHALKTTVWVVDHYTESRDILIAVDGSEKSMNILKHVIAMVGSNNKLRFVLFHVLPFLSHYYSLEFERKHPNLQTLIHERDLRRMEKFCDKALELFENAGISTAQVSYRTNKHGYDISTAILEEARRGQYGTVVIGRRGEREAYFTGRIAMRLVQKMPSPALWVVG